MHCKHALLKLVTLAYRIYEKRLSIYTEASDLHWSEIVTQIPPADRNKSLLDHSQDPLAFLSESIPDLQLRCLTVEEEAFAIMATFERMYYMAAVPSGFDLYIDDASLVFIFDPLAIVPDLEKASVRKVLRWAIRLLAYHNTCIHVNGSQNVWADMLGRWKIPTAIRRLITVPELSSAWSDE